MAAIRCLGYLASASWSMLPSMAKGVDSKRMWAVHPLPQMQPSNGKLWLLHELCKYITAGSAAVALLRSSIATLPSPRLGDSMMRSLPLGD